MTFAEDRSQTLPLPVNQRRTVFDEPALAVHGGSRRKYPFSPRRLACDPPTVTSYVLSNLGAEPLIRFQNSRRDEQEIHATRMARAAGARTDYVPVGPWPL